MAYFGSVTITNKFGWSKTVEIKKALTLVGASRTSDIMLSEEQGAGVAPLHLQLVSPRTGEYAYRAINLADQLLQIVSGPSRGALLKPRTPQEIRDGDMLQLGEFTLAFKLLSERGLRIENRSANLGMRLELPSNELRQGKRLAGILMLTNFGNTRRCQFAIEVDGLPKDCFQISPAPLLYPGASEEVQIHFTHAGTRPNAGRQSISICAYASQAYPTETLRITLDLVVEPVYKYVVEFDEPASLPIPGPAHADVPARSIHDPAGIKVNEPDPANRNVPTPAVQPLALPVEVPVVAIASVNEQDTTSYVQPGHTLLDIPEPEQVMATASNEPIPTELAQAAEPIPEPAVQPEPTPEPDLNWWVNQASVKPNQRQPDNLAASRRNIRSMLAGKDIQVIKAGEEIEEDAREPQPRQNKSTQ